MSLRGLTSVRAHARRPRTATFATEATAPRHTFPRYIPKDRKETTEAEASAYLSSLLSLPATTFPPPLALQILTHKSYRFVHRISHPPPYSKEEIMASQASHNGRLSFLGRRAIAAYTAMFVHSSLGSLGPHALDQLRKPDVESRLEGIRGHENIGYVVGNVWKLTDVMRWDRNSNGDNVSHARIQGQTVEAVIGGVFTQLGSGVAQDTYHRHILPHLIRQFRDPRLTEAAEKAKVAAEERV